MIFLISSLHLQLWDALFTLIYIGHSQSAIRWIADFPHYSILISDVMCGPSGLDFSNGSRHCASSFRIPFFYHFASLSIPFLHLVLQRWGDIVETLSNTLGMLRCCTSHVCVCSFPIKAHNQWCTYLQICIYIYTHTSRCTDLWFMMISWSSAKMKENDMIYTIMMLMDLGQTQTVQRPLL